MEAIGLFYIKLNIKADNKGLDFDAAINNGFADLMNEEEREKVDSLIVKLIREFAKSAERQIGLEGAELKEYRTLEKNKLDDDLFFDGVISDPKKKIMRH